MHTRKQIKGVLREWKSYISTLNEAKEEASAKPYVVSIFDFDGTIVTYGSEELISLMKNPYIFNLANPVFMEKFKQGKSDKKSKKSGLVIDPKVVDFINNSNEAFICSKVKSTGVDKKIANAYDSNIRSIMETGKPDDKMAVLFDFIKKNSDDHFDVVAFIKNNPSKDFDVIKREFNSSPEIKKYLRVADMTQPEEDEKIGTQNLLSLQKQRILQIISENGLKIPEENIVVTPSLALTKDTPIEGGGGAVRIEAERGTSGKIMDVYGIAKRVIDSLQPNTKVTFRLFDNVESNLGEMVDGVNKAIPGYSDVVSSTELKTVEDSIKYLEKNTRSSETYTVEARLAKPSASKIDYDVIEGRISKSKTSTTSTSSVFKGLKNAFQKIVLLMTSTTGGRRSEKVVKAFEQLLFSSEYAIGEQLKELYTNLGKGGILSTGLEDSYTDRNKLHSLIGDLKHFVAVFPRFRQEFDKVLGTMIKAKAAPAASADQSGDDTELSDEEIDAMNDKSTLDAEEAEKIRTQMDREEAELRAAKAKVKKGLAESVNRQNKSLLREFKLVLKTKK